MLCKKCGEALPNGANFCPWCGAGQTERKARKPRTRGNGQGSAYKSGKTWTAQRVFGYKLTPEGKAIPIKARKSGFATKKAALEYIPNLQPPESAAVGRKSLHSIPDNVTVKAIYDLWFPTHEARGKAKSTLGCYSAAIKHFDDLWDYSFAEVGIDDWQESIDDCPCGRRTRENMKALVGLLYKYAIPRGAAPEKINLGEYLYVTGEVGRRHPFTDLEVETIRRSVGIVPWADYIYCLIYLGYRPHEFLTREIDQHYDPVEKCLYGGIKTNAGKNRVITISPKILPIIKDIIAGRTSGFLFCGPDGGKIGDKKFREYFAEALGKMGIQATPERKLTPYCCRHTFASLLDRVKGAGDNAKLELIGHTTVDMLRHYQHAALDDLREITNAI